MAWKDILVHIDDTKAAKARLDAALTLARAHGAHLTALHVIPFPVLPGADDSLDPAFYQSLADENRRRAKVAEEMFTDTVKRLKISTEWRVAEGDMVDLLSRHGRYADLLVLGQEGEATAGRLEYRGLPDEVILDSGRPVLVVPEKGAGKTIGSNVTIAWDASARATRSLHDALPALEKAKRVEVVIINPTTGSPARERTRRGDIGAHLARHGVKAKVGTTTAKNEADALLRKAKSQKADLIVMGAYGRWRLRELVLGGVTADVLSDAAVPVLMSH